ncbi:Urease accessory protein ureF [Granulibacter bethesdensis]|nr:Urease accessory protein ureF [Granulibacter bethesdensis CGDNIH1]AHJ67970.1 Urease accessory protein ureF [Granulibacter bethesdensis]APH52937.1 Urease accessory protein ureF [Granulibacter bethesdensis]APH65625.1 Urease accessory protein ureF [Granulibacter bethesdensis]
MASITGITRMPMVTHMIMNTITITVILTRMIDDFAPTSSTGDAALYRLLSWLSPAYPVGAYTYSHGLETAVEDGLVHHRQSLADYVATVLHDGAAAIDGPLLAASWRAAQAEDHARLDELAVLGAAWRSSAETALETSAQGRAFCDVTQAAWPDSRFAAFCARHDESIVHPVAFGVASCWQGIPLRAALFGYLSAFAANLVSAGVRLIPLGQTDGQRAQAALLDDLQRATDHGLNTALEDAGSAVPMLDLFSIRHETQYTRLFRS